MIIVVLRIRKLLAGGQGHPNERCLGAIVIGHNEFQLQFPDQVCRPIHLRSEFNLPTTTLTYLLHSSQNQGAGSDSNLQCLLDLPAGTLLVRTEKTELTTITTSQTQAGEIRLSSRSPHLTQ